MGRAHPGAARFAAPARVAAAARRGIRRRELVVGTVRRALCGAAARVRRAPVNARALLLTGVLAGLFCLGFVLLYTGFPQTPQRLYIFAYLLRAQDVPGAALVIFIAIAAGWPPLGRAGLALVEAIGRQPWADRKSTRLNSSHQ